MNQDELDNIAKKNESDHHSKRAEELMKQNAQKGLFIVQYFTCKNCGDISDEGKKVDALTKVIENSNSGLSGFSVGWTELGLQIWCETCDSNVINFDFKGTKSWISSLSFISYSNFLGLTGGDHLLIIL